jgi:hypothetical protein
VTESAGYTKLDREYIASCQNSSALSIVTRDLSLLWRTVMVMAKGEGLQF